MKKMNKVQTRNYKEATMKLLQGMRVGTINDRKACIVNTCEMTGKNYALGFFAKTSRTISDLEIFVLKDGISFELVPKYTNEYSLVINEMVTKQSYIFHKSLGDIILKIGLYEMTSHDLIES